MREGRTKIKIKNNDVVVENKQEKELSFSEQVLLAFETVEEIITPNDFLQNYVFS